MTSRLFLILGALAVPLLAQDGQQLYTLNCSICHGADGNGGVAANPPLAASPWVAGEADRAVKIVLKGLSGPIEVLGKSYNLQMPAQGAVLQDDKIAAILTYVRSAWGNNASAVTPAFVKNVRASVADRTDLWTAEELLKLHPLPVPKTALSELKSQTYKGSWDHLPDFKTLTAENVEEEHDGIISLKDATLSENFGMVWEGKFEIPTTGEYVFTLDADDGGKVILDDEVLVEIQGIGPMDGSRAQSCINTVTAGSHRFRAEYIQNKGNKGIIIGWRPKSRSTFSWLTDDAPPPGKNREQLMIAPTRDRPVIHRSSIKGTTARAIGVGFPGGVNLAYSTDNLSPELIWKGNFMDGTHKWAGRGTEDAPPAGTGIVNLTKTRFLPEEARFKGYKLDATGNPTFSVKLGEHYLLDSWQATDSGLSRKLSLASAAKPLVLVLAEKDLSAQITIQAEGEELKTESGQTKLTLTPGKQAVLTYRWK